MDIFFEIHKDLPREGPGSFDSTKKAFRKLQALPDKPTILDVGCGPGAQTLDLASLSDGTIQAVDRHQPFLDRLAQKVKDLGLEDRIKVSNQSMSELNFPPGSFDLIWSEGAIYIMGFEEGLRAWKPLLKEDGYIAVTEVTWVMPDPPEEVRAFWNNNYPGMKTLDENLQIIHDCNYYLIDYFVIPDTCWIDEYYQPMQDRIEMLRQKYADQPDFQKHLDAELEEIEIFRKYNQYYGYVFYIMQNKSEN